MPQILLPADTDQELFVELAGLAANRYVFNPELVGGQLELSYLYPDFDEVMTAVDTYDEALIVKRRKLKAAEASAARWTNEQTFVYDNIVIASDLGARTNVAGAIILMQLPGAPATRRWKMSPTERRDLTVLDMILLGAAMATHVQLCFDNEESLLSAIAEAETLEEIAAVDVTVGWPSQEPEED